VVSEHVISAGIRRDEAETFVGKVLLDLACLHGGWCTISVETPGGGLVFTPLVVIFRLVGHTLTSPEALRVACKLL